MNFESPLEIAWRNSKENANVNTAFVSMINTGSVSNGRKPDQWMLKLKITINHILSEDHDD